MQHKKKNNNNNIFLFNSKHTYTLSIIYFFFLQFSFKNYMDCFYLLLSACVQKKKEKDKIDVHINMYICNNAYFMRALRD